MSFRKTWSKNFFVDQFDVSSPSGHIKPHPCPLPEHATTDPETGEKRVSCFRCRQDRFGPESSGDWKLRSPIDIPSIMPGTKQKILSITALGMYMGSWGSSGWIHYNAIMIYADNSEIFKHANLPHPKNKWTDPPTFIEVSKSLEDKTSLSLTLHQHVLVGLFAEQVQIHDNKIIINCEYYNEVPPVYVPVTVNVLDQETGKPLKNARVTIKSGARVIADGYTDGNGVKFFEKIQTGGYTLRVTFSGYNMAEQAIQVVEPEVAYDVFLVAIPAKPLDWWVLPAMVGGIGLGGFVLLRGRPKMPPIMVVR